MRKVWTTKEVAHMRAWYGRKPVEVVAAELGRTPESVRQYACKVLGIKSVRPHRLAQNVDAIKRLIYDGLGPQQIADRLGISKQSVYSRVREGQQYDKLDRHVLLVNSKAQRGA